MNGHSSLSPKAAAFAPTLHPPPPTSDQSSAQTALEIPEILLSILSNFCTTVSTVHTYAVPEEYPAHKRALSRFALVSKAWRAPSQQTLFAHLRFDWRFTTVERLSKCLEGSSHLCFAVRACELTGWDEDDLFEEVGMQFDHKGFLRQRGYEWEDEEDDEFKQLLHRTYPLRAAAIGGIAEDHLDNEWIGEEGELHSAYALLKFLERLGNLRHLSLASMRLPTLRLTPRFLWEGVYYVLGGLSTFQLHDSEDFFSHDLLALTTNIHSLSVTFPQPTLEFPPSPSLRHLHLAFPSLTTTSVDLDTISQRLETLSITIPKMCELVETVIPALSALSHLTISTWEYADKTRDFATSLVSSCPRLKYLAIDNAVALPTLVPFFPSTLTTLEASIDTPDAQLVRQIVHSLVSGSPRKVQLKQISLYVPSMARHGAEAWETKAKSQGIDLKFMSDSTELPVDWMGQARMIDLWRGGNVGTGR